MTTKPVKIEAKKRGRKSKEDIFQAALDKFADQFGVELASTGYENLYGGNDGIGEQEYWVKGLITGPLNFEVGGWFSHDTRDHEHRIYCLLAVKVNGKDLGECQGIQSWYDNETQEWSELKWESF